jgi:hypothetical protein
MANLKKYLIVALIALAVGLWFGVNLGRGQPLLANPFAEQNLTEKAKDAASDAWKDAKKAARDSLSE